VKVRVIDNGGQWTHREWRVLRDLGVETTILPNTTPGSALDADAVVLSGGALSLEGTDSTLGEVGAWIDGTEVPVLGICVGHQFLGRHFGGRVVRGDPEFGATEVTVDRPDHPLFAGLPTTLRVWSNHNDHVVDPPPGWSPLAHSKSCPVQAMAHPTRLIWGVQFHPEVAHTDGGAEIFRRFLAQVRR
jgi:GMP synthase (glutamine-hydrolysing)